MPPESLSEQIINPLGDFPIIAPVQVEPVNLAPEPNYLIPTLPNNTTVYKNGKPEVDSANLLDFFLKDRKSDAQGQLYDYTTKQEERYSNPFMQYTPNAQGSFSTEDAYGKKQGAGEQLYNALIKTGATAGSTFISGFASVPREIDAIRSGKQELYKPSTFSNTQDWLHSLEDKYPNYMTQVETDRSWIVNAFTPTGAANFWGDSVLKNMGFTIGSLANAVVVDTAITALSGGTATPASLILAGKQLSNAIKPLRSVYKALTKSATLGKADDVIGLASSQGILKSLDATNKAFGIKSAAQLMATTYASAQGEAMIEGYQTYIDTKTDLLEKAYSDGKAFTPELLNSIDETASSAGKNTMLLNTVLLSASNLVQFPKILGWAKGSDVLEKAAGGYIDITKKAGLNTLEATSTWTSKSAYRNFAKDAFLKSFLPEAFEEGSQAFIGDSLHDYYLDKFDNKTKKSMSEYMVSAIPKTLQNGEFWKEALIGGFTGMISGAVMGGEVATSFKENIRGQQKTNNYIESLNKDLEVFNSHIGELSALEQDLNANTRTDKFQAAYKSLHKTVANAARFGKLEELKSAIEELNNLPVEEYNKSFFEADGLKSDLQKSEVINKILDEIDNIEANKIAIEKAHKKNPFSNNHVKRMLIEKFKVDKRDLEGVQGKLFEDWKESQSYLLGRLRNTSIDIDQIKDDLKLGNVGTEEDFQTTYTTLLALGNPDAIYSYLSHKNRQIESLKTQAQYYDSLGDKVKSSQIKSTLKHLNSYYDKIQAELNKSEKPDLKETKFDNLDALRKLIISEEFSGTTGEEVFEKIQEAKFQEQIRKLTEEELVKTAEDPEKSATAMTDVLDKIQESEDANNPETVDTPDLEPHPSQYSFVRTLNKGTKIKYNGVIYTLKNTSVTNVETEEGVIFTPQGFVINGAVVDYKHEVTLHTPEEPKKVSTVESQKKIDKFWEELQELIRGKEVVKTPSKEGGRYVIYGTVPTEKGFDIWTLENGKLVIKTGSKKKTLTVKPTMKFYSLDGEAVVQEAAPEVIVPITPPAAKKAEPEEYFNDQETLDIPLDENLDEDFGDLSKGKVLGELGDDGGFIPAQDATEKIVEAKPDVKSTSQEQIDFFIGASSRNNQNDTRNILKDVLLQAINKNYINLDCK